MGIKVQDLPTTITGSTGDFLIKDKAVGGSGATQKISIANFILTYLQSLFDAKQEATSEEGIIAFAGGGQGSATALTAAYNFIDTAATTNDSVKVLAATVNRFQYIQNGGANDVEVFPQTGENFSGLAANASLIISPGGSLTLKCVTAGTYRYF